MNALADRLDLSRDRALSELRESSLHSIAADARVQAESLMAVRAKLRRARGFRRRQWLRRSARSFAAQVLLAAKIIEHCRYKGEWPPGPSRGWVRVEPEIQFVGFDVSMVDGWQPRWDK